MGLGFEPIADIWLAHVRDQGNAWFGYARELSQDEVGERRASIPPFLHVRAAET